MAKTILRNTDTKTSVKVASATTINETITLATDLVSSDQVAGATPKANIISVSWAGVPGGYITITRNSVVILNLSTDSPGSFDFEDAHFVDTIEDTKDIVVTSTVAAQCYLTIRKMASGYTTKVENATYGAYDDPTRVGARTDKMGSPDYIAP